MNEHNEKKCALIIGSFRKYRTEIHLSFAPHDHKLTYNGDYDK